MFDEVVKSSRLPWPARAANAAVVMATAQNVIRRTSSADNYNGKQALREALGGRSAYYERD